MSCVESEMLFERDDGWSGRDVPGEPEGKFRSIWVGDGRRDVEVSELERRSCAD